MDKLVDNDVIAVIRQVGGIPKYSSSSRLTDMKSEGSVTSQESIPVTTLRFSSDRKSRKGFMFGAGRSSPVDFVFAGQGVADRQFCLTFDKSSKRLKLLGLNAIRNMAVLYGNGNGNDNGAERRGKFQWLLSGPSHIFREPMTFTIHVNGTAYFKIDVSDYEHDSLTYVQQVDNFLARVPRNLRCHADLLESHPDTRHIPEPGSDSDSELESDDGISFLREDPVLVKQEIGDRGLGTIIYRFNVFTGEETVKKRPTNKAIRDRSYNLERWKTEIRLLERLKGHPRIIKLLKSELDPPTIVLEYASGGSLANKTFTRDNTRMIVEQILEGLAYMHQIEDPIAHRDLKPQNILLMERKSGLSVKICDFGLSKDTKDLVSTVGTLGYLAPEYYDAQCEVYTPAQDLWSLGVMSLALLNELGPRSRHLWQTKPNMCIQHILQDLAAFKAKFPKDPLCELLGNILVENPRHRWTAQQCLGYLCAQKPPADGAAGPSNSTFEQKRTTNTSGTSRPTAEAGSSGSGASQATIRGPAAEYEPAAHGAAKKQVTKRALSSSSQDDEHDAPQKRLNRTTEARYRITQTPTVVRDAS